MATQLRDVVIVAYGRSAVGKAKKGSLRNTMPIDFGAQVLKAVVAKVPQLDPRDIGDVIIGCAKHESVQSYNMARLLTIRAGLPFEAPAQTINRFCASGLQAIVTAANAITLGQMDVAIAGGVEALSAFAIGPSYKDPWLEENTDAYMSNGQTAENVAEKYSLTRKELDLYGIDSNNKADAAIKEGRFTKSIIPVKALDDDGKEFVFKDDEGPRPGGTLESMAKMKPFVKEDGVCTAANSSQMNDAAAMMILMSREKAEKLGIKPLARFVSAAVAGLDPAYMGLGPMYAVPQALKQSGISMDDIDVVELNEAFAAQVLPCIKETGMDPAKVNVNGGGIALGHPLGATGTILTIKALDELERVGGKYALVTMCIGGGMGLAGVFERL
jgi:acetyl-CoA acyltransferase